MAGEVIEIQGGVVRLFRVDGEGRRQLERQVSLRSMADALVGRGPWPATTKVERRRIASPRSVSPGLRRAAGNRAAQVA